MVVDVGNWFLHKRHLQLQADAGALAGGGVFTFPCSDDAIVNETRRYAGDPAAARRTTFRSRPRISRTFTCSSTGFVLERGWHRLQRRRPSCAAKFVDLKITEAQPPWYFGFNVVPADQRACPCHDPSRCSGLEVHFRWRCPTSTRRSGGIFFIDEANGTVLASTPLTKTGSTRRSGSRPGTTWQRPLRSRSTRHGSAFGSPSGAAPRRRAATISSSATTSGPRTGSCSSAAIRRVVPGRPRTRRSPAMSGSSPAAVPTRTSTCSGPRARSASTPRSTSGACRRRRPRSRRWSAEPSTSSSTTRPRQVDLDLRGQQLLHGRSCRRPDLGRVEVGGERARDHRREQLHDDRRQQVQGHVRHRAANVRGSIARSGPIELAKISEGGVSGANSFALARHTTSSSGSGSRATCRTPRASRTRSSSCGSRGSQNQSIDCDPDLPNLRDEIAQGCAPHYAINTGAACPPTARRSGRRPSRGTASPFRPAAPSAS